MEGSLNKLNQNVFSQKGGTFGMVVLAGIAVIIAFNATAILAWCTTILNIIVVCACIAGLLFVLTDKKIRLIVSTAYMVFIKKMLGVVVKMDPISILEGVIEKMEHAIENMEMNMGKLNGVRKSLIAKIKAKKIEFENCVLRMKTAQASGNSDLAYIEQRQSVRLKELCDTYIDLSNSTETWYKDMSKIAEMAKLTVLDSKNEVECQKEKYEAVKLSHNAFKSAMSVINGSPDDYAMYNLAFQYVQDDIMAKLGEMDRVMNTAGGLIAQIDNEKALNSLKGKALIDQYDQLGIEGIFAKLESKTSVNDFMKLNAEEAQVIETKPLVKTELKSKYF
jgi:hypothetical protein